MGVAGRGGVDAVAWIGGWGVLTGLAEAVLPRCNRGVSGLLTAARVRVFAPAAVSGAVCGGG